jgi:hypothetical protein
MGHVIFWLGNDAGGGKPLPLVDDPVDLFDDDYELSWLNSSLGKAIIKDIDKSMHVKDRLIESPVLGGISPRELSCGCKSVLLAAFHPDISEKFLDGSRMGDNCYPILFKVARETGRDVKVQVGRVLHESWGEGETVLFMPKKESIKGFKACQRYLALNSSMFYRG